MLPFGRMMNYGNEVAPPAGIKKINSFGTSQMILTNTGEVYAYGQNTNWRFGSGSSDEISGGVPQMVMQGVSDMICHPRCTLLRMADGRYLAAGNSTVLGGSSGLNYVDVSSKFEGLGTITKIDFTRRNNASFTVYALNTDGDLYGIGYGNRGQLGLGTANSLGVFTKINTNCRNFVSCSYETIVALKNDNTAWFCGNYQFVSTSTDVTAFTNLGDTAILNIYGNGLNGELLYTKSDGLYFRGLASNRYGYSFSADQRAINSKITLPFTYDVSTFKILTDEQSSTVSVWISNSDVHYGVGANSSDTNRMGFTNPATPNAGSNFTLQDFSSVHGTIETVVSASNYTTLINSDGKVFGSGPFNDDSLTYFPGNNPKLMNYAEIKLNIS
ncbi:hypothetical protein [Escherichia coli]|uniref:hypothetical protein n=1 Tax=Escherichia coli TaxID=562 RepID=UPI0021CEC860|nr:hypothetical protein [Escherichia coli]MCU6293961.1 hypothetical protein [Escherichia coli]